MERDLLRMTQDVKRQFIKDGGGKNGVKWDFSLVRLKSANLESISYSQ